MSLSQSWPKLILIVLPLLIAVVSVTTVIYEHFQSDASKAMRLVKESNSRKENFTVQQYLYTTVYYRRDKGEPISIAGWRAQESGDASMLRIDFVYSDAGGEHVASWLADVKNRSVSPQNDEAKDLSWH